MTSTDTDTVLVNMTINGKKVYSRVPKDMELIDFLQEELDLTGTKFCCGIGVCRACTVSYRLTPEAPPLPMLACSTPVASLAENSVLETVEGLAESDSQLTAMQKAFLTNFSFQCGYCTPGFLMAATILVERLKHSPIRRDEIDAAIADACGPHICRCTGYVRYYQAIKEVIEKTPGALV